MSPVNPDAPPPILPARAVTAVRTAAHKNRNALLFAAIGGGVFLLLVAGSVTLASAFSVTAAFFTGALIHSAMGGK